MEFGVWGFGFGLTWKMGFRVLGLGLRWKMEFRVWGLGLIDRKMGCLGFGFRV